MLDPDLLGAFATLYGVGAACTALLQARQVVRRRSSCEVSARFFATYAGGYAVWLLYGLSIGSVPLILVDAVGLLCGLVTLAVTLRMRCSLLRPATWGKCPEHAPHTIDRAAGDHTPDTREAERRSRDHADLARHTHLSATPSARSDSHDDTARGDRAARPTLARRASGSAHGGKRTPSAPGS